MSSEAKKQKNDFLRMALTLFGISALVAALLGLANYFTAPIIANSADARLQTSLKSLMADADHFSFVDQFEEKVVVNEKSIRVEAVYQAKNGDDEAIGYCVQVQPMGYSKKIDMLVAIDSEGAVSGTKILSMSDTPGIGMKVYSDTVFQESVIGLDRPVKIVKDSTVSNGVQVISGATVSSSAYINGVNAALEVVKPLYEEVQS